MADKTKRLLNTIERNTPKVEAIISKNFILPNHSGAAKTPTLSKDIANKKYVDDNAGGSPGGNNTEVQFNNGGVFGGSSNLTFDGDQLTVGDETSTANQQIKVTDAGSAEAAISFQNSDSGFTNTDGFKIGIYPSSNVELGLIENAIMFFKTNNTVHLAIEADGEIKIPLDNQKVTWGAGNDASIYWDTSKFIIDASAADLAQLADQPTGGTDLAIATTKYVDDNAGDTGNWTFTNSILDHDASTAADATISNSDQDKDVLVKINDGGVSTTAIQIHGDEGSVSMPKQTGIRVKPSSDQSISINTWTTVNFATEYIDTLGEWSTNTFTAKVAGKYIVSGMINYDNTNAGKFYAVNFAGTCTRTFSSRDYGDNQPQKSFNFHGLIECAVGETFYIQTYQNASTETLDNRFCWLALIKVA